MTLHGRFHSSCEYCCPGLHHRFHRRGLAPRQGHRPALHHCCLETGFCGHSAGAALCKNICHARAGTIQRSPDPFRLSFYSDQFCHQLAGRHGRRQNGRDRGAFIQGSFRGNFAILGFAMLSSAYGSSVLAPAAVVLAAIMPPYNILSVLALSLTLKKERHISGWTITKQILTNPLIIAAAIAVPFSLAQISLPQMMLTSIEHLSSLTLPLALIGIGGSLSFSGVRQDFRLALLRHPPENPAAADPGRLRRCKMGVQRSGAGRALLFLRLAHRHRQLPHGRSHGQQRPPGRQHHSAHHAGQHLYYLFGDYYLEVAGSFLGRGRMPRGNCQGCCRHRIRG